MKRTIKKKRNEENNFSRFYFARSAEKTFYVAPREARRKFWDFTRRTCWDFTNKEDYKKKTKWKGKFGDFTSLEAWK